MAAANVRSYEEMAQRADTDLAGFWAEQPARFEWFQPWDKVLDDSKKHFYKWFVGGKTNIAYNCLDRHDLSSLRLLGTVGEPINPEAWRWYHRVIGKERCPIMDTW